MALIDDSQQPKNPFEYQQPSNAQVEMIIKFRSECKLLYDMINDNLPNSRYRAVAITKLEEVSMWLNKAVAFTA